MQQCISAAGSTAGRKKEQILCIYVCVYIYKYIYIYVCVCIFINIYIYVCVCVCVYMGGGLEWRQKQANKQGMGTVRNLPGGRRQTKARGAPAVPRLRGLLPRLQQLLATEFLQRYKSRIVRLHRRVSLLSQGFT